MAPAPSASLRPLVDQEQKNKLVLQKQVHQATSQMLRRPSHFSRGQGEMSRPVLEALLSQRSQGRLTGSALECWVERFEVYHSQTFGGRHEEDVELQFQALNREFEAEYATVSLDSSVPQHRPLDCSAARTRPARQKGLSTVSRLGPGPALAPVLAWPGPGPALTSPREHQAQPSNVARQLKQQEGRGRDQGGAIVLGREPDAKPTLPTAARFPFLQRLAGRQEPTYEEVAAVHRRKQETPLPPRPRSATPRAAAGPAATLLEELYEEVGGTAAEVDEEHRPTEEKGRAPFQRLHDALFRGLTAVLPWRLMRRVYWRRDGSSEQRFTESARARRRAGRELSEVNTSCAPTS